MRVTGRGGVNELAVQATLKDRGQERGQREMRVILQQFQVYPLESIPGGKHIQVKGGRSITRLGLCKGICSYSGQVY